jgi:hypothetical protein
MIGGLRMGGAMGIASLFVASCNGSGALTVDGGTTGATGPATASAFCAQARAAIAAITSRCRTGTIDEWIAALATYDGDCSRLDRLVAKGTVAYHREKAAACLAELDPNSDCLAAGDCYPQVLEGKVRPGAPCGDYYECSPDAACVAPGELSFNACAVSTCTVFPTKAGDACVDFPSVCFGDLSCINGLCVANLAAGVPCDAATPSCQRGLTCGPTNRCVRLGKDGEPCAAESDCEATLFCANANCAPRIARGGACDPVVGGCVHFATCDAATAHCVSAGHVGEPCSDFDCIGSLCNLQDVCEALQTLGQPCTVGGTCASNGCRNGVCASCP